MSNNRFSLYSCDFIGGSGTVTFKQLHGADVMFGQSVDEEVPGGAVDRAWSMLAFAEAKGGIMTYDLATVIDSVPLLTGLKCTSGALIRGRRRDDSGTFNSGNVHAYFASALGWLGCTSISVRQRSAAEARLEYWSHYNGETKPWTFTEAGNASGITAPGTNSKFYLGPVDVVTGVTRVRLTDVQGVEINPGLMYQWIDGDGDVWPKNGAIYLRKPSIRIDAKSLSQLTAVGGLFLTEQTNIDVYLKRGAVGDDGRVADATTSNIRIRVATGTIKPDDVSVRGNDDWGGSLTVLPSGTIASASNLAIAAAP